MHNALNQISLPLQNIHVDGFSVSGLSTYLQIPEMDFCFDMGECPLSAVSLNHVALTHAHGDHSRCLMRHDSLRRMLGIEKEAVYYIPYMLVDAFKKVIEAESVFENVPKDKFKMPKIISVQPNTIIPLAYRKDLAIRAFEVKHRAPTFGYELLLHKHKLKPEYIGLNSKELVALKRQGTSITKETYDSKVCFMGDCIGESLLENEHVWQSEILICESTFLDENEKDMARQKGHIHIEEIANALLTFEHTMQIKHLVLTHFSMKYSYGFIKHKVYQVIPERFHPFIHIFRE
jgi:ribonuclease Z